MKRVQDTSIYILKTWCYVTSEKVKQSLYRPSAFQDVEGAMFEDNRHMKVVRLSALSNGCLYPQKIFLVLLSEADPTDIMRSERLCQWKIPMIPSWIEAATVRLEERCLNQLGHRVPHVSSTFPMLSTFQNVRNVRTVQDCWTDLELGGSAGQQ